jgi:hypothetical protein
MEGSTSYTSRIIRWGCLSMRAQSRVHRIRIRAVNRKGKPCRSNQRWRRLATMLKHRPAIPTAAKGAVQLRRWPHTHHEDCMSIANVLCSLHASREEELTNWRLTKHGTDYYNFTTREAQQPVGISSFLEGYMVSHIHILAGSVLWRYA